MFAIMVSVLNVALAFVVRSILVKFVVYFALFFITTEFISVIGSILPTGSDLSSALGGLPQDVWFYLDLFNVSAGIPILLSAWITRFIIRRIPVIG